MRICVFGAAREDIDGKYKDGAFELCKSLAEHGHSLVYGAASCGIMGASARGFKAGGANIIGVIPEWFRTENIEPIYDGCDEIIFTSTMSERKSRMTSLADAILTLPGGVGTLEEYFETLTLKHLGRHHKPMPIYNMFGYYDGLKSFMDTAASGNFITSSCAKNFVLFDTPSATVEYIDACAFGKTAT